MPKINFDGKTRHYAYTPEGKAQYKRDKAALKMSPGMRFQDGGSGTGSGTYTPPKPTQTHSSRIKYPNTPKPSTSGPKRSRFYPNTPKPSTTKPKGKRKHVMPTSRDWKRYVRPKPSDSGLGTDGKENFKSAGKEIGKRLKTKSRTRSKY